MKSRREVAHSPEKQGRWTDGSATVAASHRFLGISWPGPERSQRQQLTDSSPEPSGELGAGPMAQMETEAQEGSFVAQGQKAEASTAGFFRSRPRALVHLSRCLVTNVATAPGNYPGPPQGDRTDPARSPPLAIHVR